MLSGFFTCLFDFWVLFAEAFSSAKKALATLRKRWAIHTCLSWTFPPAQNSQRHIEQSSCFWQTQRLSMIYLWYSSTFSFNGTQVIMKSTKKTKSWTTFNLWMPRMVPGIPGIPGIGIPGIPIPGIPGKPVKAPVPAHEKSGGGDKQIDLQPLSKIELQIIDWLVVEPTHLKNMNVKLGIFPK